ARRARCWCTTSSPGANPSGLRERLSARGHCARTRDRALRPRVRPVAPRRRARRARARRRARDPGAPLPRRGLPPRDVLPRGARPLPPPSGADARDRARGAAARAVSVAVLQAVAFVLVGAVGTAVVLARDVRRQVLVNGVYGLTLVLLFVILQAPDVALSVLV